MVAISGAPIDPQSFGQAMAALGPFERAPVVAVAVSGGADSMALTLLADAWARRLGGSVIGLTVDHGLRQGSAAEARQVGAWLAARGIAHAILPWIGEKPASRLQERARHARYALLEAACAARGILHLALAHHADDQAETILFRKERGSSQSGLAGMPASRSLGGVKLIRPLMAWPKFALIATCAAFGQNFVDDPSNRSNRFARTAIRARLAADPGLRTEILDAAMHVAAARAAFEHALGTSLGRIAEIWPQGAVLVDRVALAALDPVLRLGALGAMVLTCGAGRYPPPVASLRRLEAQAANPAFAGISLGGAIVRPWRGRLLACREPARVPREVAIVPGQWQQWDARFALRVTGHRGPLTVGALGRAAYAGLRSVLGSKRAALLPAMVAETLPAVRCNGIVVAVPGLSWLADGTNPVDQRWTPLWPLSAETFTVVSGLPGIIFDNGWSGP